MNVTWFDSLTLSACLVCVLLFKSNRNDSAFVALSMAVYMNIAALNLSFLAEYYYVLTAFIEVVLIGVGISLRVKTSILIIFLISIVYNTLSFIEFTTSFNFIYSNYEMVMQGLILSLLFINFKNGIADGTNGDHNNSGYTDNVSYSRFFRWKAL